MRPIIARSLLAGVMVLGIAGEALGQTSQWVFVGPDGKLAYQTLPNGDQIMDFSSAGYMGGGVTLPDQVAAVQQMVEPSGGDDTMALQAAIDAVSALPVINGFRGMVLLDVGQFNISSALHIRASGVVLSGMGSSSGGTVINMIDNGSGFHALDIAGSGSYSTSNTVNIVDPYVPSGTNTITVSGASGFSVGDAVLISRPVTQDWIHYLGMDMLVRNGQPQTWIPVGHHITTDRTIQAISENTITLDVPVSDSFDSTYLGTPVGTISKYTFPGRISQVGVEHLQFLAPAGSVVYNAVTMDSLTDSWMLDVVGQETMNAFNVNGKAKRVTLDSVINNVSIRQTNSAAPTAFAVDGTQVLLNNCQANSLGIWPFVTQSTGTGPTVVLNFSTTENHPLEPHQRWYTGLLTDNGAFSSGVSYINRRNAGSGHGWASGWAVAWNVTGGRFVISAAPGTESWCIGCEGTRASNHPDPDGIFDSLGAFVSPTSLYLAQLCERLGPDALVNIGYDGSYCAVPPSSAPAVLSWKAVHVRRLDVGSLAFLLWPADQAPYSRFLFLICVLSSFSKGGFMSVNKVILVGRLGRDPETRYTGGGQAVANFTVATDESYKDRNGERQKRTEWHRIVVWGKQAEIAQQYLRKGSLIFVEGRIQSREWQDKEGQKRTTFEIVATGFRMLGGRAEAAAAAATGGMPRAVDEAESPAALEEVHPMGPEISDEDIPF